MISLEHDSQANKPLRGRPSTNGVNGNAAAPSSRRVSMAQTAGAIVPAPGMPVRPLAFGHSQGLQGAAPRLQPGVAEALAALGGPSNRPPLVYTGDAAASLAALRQDITSTYHSLCRVVGEAPRADLLSGALPAAAALGVNLPMPPPSSAPVLPALGRLPGIPAGGGRGVHQPLLLPPPPTGLPSSSQVHSEGGMAMGAGLGSVLGIESVGSGAAVPLRSSGGSSNSSSGGGALRTLNLAGHVGGLRSLSAGHVSPYALQQPQLGSPWRSGAGAGGQQGWPLGRPSAPLLAGQGAVTARGGPRVTALSGFSRPQDTASDFLGEESALVYPPPGRSFGGGVGSAARGAGAGRWGFRGGGGGSAPGATAALIDPMDDLRFRSGSSKAIAADPLEGLPALGAPGRRPEGDQLESFLRDFARERSKPLPGESADGKANRYRMPF
ncbi:hypothetical protein Agub_g15881 [Astrephomene gubernaculifera]|uniref:Uncharacterized protein n=1 Tax=Astrephomene gubernaculifera TaxID=47775 RepID=A0AAD3E3X1_9CHLO|nr:hypothetical protein Agub_g15881 [Astrephomene gubernaculifera]